MNRFDHQEPDDDQVIELREIREAFQSIEWILLGTPSRHRSLAATALEEAAMWASKAVFD